MSASYGYSMVRRLGLGVACFVRVVVKARTKPVVEKGIGRVGSAQGCSSGTGERLGRVGVGRMKTVGRVIDPLVGAICSRLYARRGPAIKPRQ